MDIFKTTLVIALAQARPETLASALQDAIGSTPRSWPTLVAAGLLVGIGTRLGNGCTSGHGVCGISRLSPRSFIATVTFIGAGMVAVRLVAWFGGVQ